jgi:hypothetical protein
MEACVLTLNVDTNVDTEGFITVAVEGNVVFHGNMVDAIATRGAIDGVLAEGGFAGFSQNHIA